MPRRTVLSLLTMFLVALASLVVAPAAVAADRDCGDFGSQREAQIFFLNQGGPHSDPHRLDSDGDGIACESNPGPYYYGTTPPGGGGGGDAVKPQPQATAVRSTVHLALNPSKRIAGESFRISVSVRPAIRRKVVVQHKVNGRWSLFGSGVTGQNGRVSGSFKAPQSRVAYRAVVKPVAKGNKKFSGATSRARTVDIQRQGVVLSFDESVVAQGQQVLALVRATPVRVGRSVALQRRSAGTWQTVRTGKFNRLGQATFTITPEVGQYSYRAVALPHQGAAAQVSNTETLTATDVTPPPTPHNLVAVPGDGAVQLSWTQSSTADFSHHEVWVRTAGTTWSLVTVTELENYAVTLLENDVMHWFAVTSVDTTGNVSEMSPGVAVTPTAPMAGP